MQTQEIIAGMLKENTGKAMLDSGGENGRAWQHNQAIDFEKTPIDEIEIGEDGISFTKSLYHHLAATLEFSAPLQALYNEATKDSEEVYLHDIETFIDWAKENLGATASKDCFNSYNEDCSLSQTIQGHAFKLGEKEYVALQIHGGCDARGGYTAPKIFEIVEESFWMWNYGEILCSECDASWFTDDGFHWYSQNADDNINLEERKLTFNKKGKAICPCCNKGVLNV